VLGGHDAAFDELLGEEAGVGVGDLAEDDFVTGGEEGGTIVEWEHGA